MALPGLASAQDQPAGQQGGAGSSTPENAEATRAARDLFMQGMEHYEQHRFREAVRAFQMAAERVPSADLWFNIARAHEQLNEYGPAIEHYRRYLRDRVDPPDRERIETLILALEERAEAARQARREEPTTGTLRVNSNQDGAAVVVDQHELGNSPVDVPLTLQPGRHHLSVHREGYVPFEAEVDVRAGVATAAFADLQPATAYRSTQGGRLFTWIVGGLAVASLGASTYFAIQAEGSRADAADNAIADPAGSRALYQDALDSASASDWLLGGAIALAVGAAVLYFIEGRAVSTERVTGPED